MSESLELLSLQLLDDELAIAGTARADNLRRLEGDEELNAARETATDLGAQLEAARKEQRRLDGERGTLTAKIEREEGRLYDGSVKNPKELLSLQHEVDSLKAAGAKLDDELLPILESIETLTASHKDATRQLTSLNARWHVQSQSLQQDVARLDGVIAATEGRRAAKAATIDPRTVRLYDSLRARKGGKGVARVSGANCAGCRVSLPDAFRRRAMSPTGITQCPNCERILVVG